MFLVLWTHIASGEFSPIFGLASLTKADLIIAKTSDILSSNYWHQNNEIKILDIEIAKILNNKILIVIVKIVIVKIVIKIVKFRV
jgi:hypothetical protein